MLRIGQGLRYWLLQSGDGFLFTLLVLAFFWQLGAPNLWDTGLADGYFAWQSLDLLQQTQGNALGAGIMAWQQGLPVLPIALQAFSISQFGYSEWVIRLPSALAASGWVIAAYYFAKSYFNLAQARLAAVLLAGSLGVVWAGHTGTADSWLGLWFSLILFDAWRWWQSGNHWLFARLFVWLVLVLVSLGQTHNQIPLWAGILAVLPFVGFLIPDLKRFKTAIGLERYLWLTLTLSLLAFVILNEAYRSFVLVGVTALALLIALYSSQARSIYWVSVPLVLFALVWLFLPELLEWNLPTSQPLLEQAQKFTDLRFRGLVGIYIAAILLLTFWPRLSVYWRLVGLSVLNLLFLTTTVLPLTSFMQQGAIKEAARFARHYITDAPMVMSQDQPSFSFYRSQTTSVRQPQVGEYALMSETQLTPAEAYIVVFRQSGWVLAKRVTP